MLRLFSKKHKQTQHLTNNERQLVKDHSEVLRELKRRRAIYCQNKGMTLNAMGKDLAHIERVGQQLYSTALEGIEQGKSATEIYAHMLDNHVNTDLERQILTKLIVLK